MCEVVRMLMCAGVGVEGVREWGRVGVWPVGVVVEEKKRKRVSVRRRRAVMRERYVSVAIGWLVVRRVWDE